VITTRFTTTNQRSREPTTGAHTISCEAKCIAGPTHSAAPKQASSGGSCNLESIDTHANSANGTSRCRCSCVHWLGVLRARYSSPSGDVAAAGATKHPGACREHDRTKHRIEQPAYPSRRCLRGAPAPVVCRRRFRSLPVAADAKQLCAQSIRRKSFDALGRESPAIYSDLERFITTEEPLLRKRDATAAGGGGSTAMLAYLGKQQDLRGALDYLLLRSWTRPSAQPRVVHGALMRYFSQQPVHEPQVWLRIALERSDPQVLQAVTEQSMPLVDHSAALAALNAERTRLLQEKRALPESAESLRVRLMRGK
jgi:hypothetical protein